MHYSLSGRGDTCTRVALFMDCSGSRPKTACKLLNLFEHYGKGFAKESQKQYFGPFHDKIRVTAVGTWANYRQG